jgi:hypothetical protein
MDELIKSRLGWSRPLNMMTKRVETKAVFDLICRLERGVLVGDSMGDLLSFEAEASLVVAPSGYTLKPSRYVAYLTARLSCKCLMARNPSWLLPL